MVLCLTTILTHTQMQGRLKSEDVPEPASNITEVDSGRK